MECGIFALLGVALGVAAVRYEEFKGFLKKLGKSAVSNEKEEALSITKQWENLLNYDGKKQ